MTDLCSAAGASSPPDEKGVRRGHAVDRGSASIEVAEYGFVPSCGAVLADWGADVIKVERPSGDPLRAHAKAGLTAGTPDFDVVIEQFNRNKRGIAIDLTTDAGHGLLERLIVGADVFLTSYLPSTRQKLRIDTDDVFAINPNLVYARGSGQGQRGPDADTGGFDSVSFWSRGGVGHMLSPPGGPLVMQRAAEGDGPSGMFLAGGIAAALFERARNGPRRGRRCLVARRRGVDPVPRHRRVVGAGDGSAEDGSEPSTNGPTDRVVRHRRRPVADAQHARRRQVLGPGVPRRSRSTTGSATPSTTRPTNDRASRRRSPRGPSTSGPRALRAEGCIFSKMATPLEVLDDVQVTDARLRAAPPHARDGTAGVEPRAVRRRAGGDDARRARRRRAHAGDPCRARARRDARSTRFAADGVIATP